MRHSEVNLQSLKSNQTSNTSLQYNLNFNTENLTIIYHKIPTHLRFVANLLLSFLGIDQHLMEGVTTKNVEHSVYVSCDDYSVLHYLMMILR